VTADSLGNSYITGTFIGTAYFGHIVIEASEDDTNMFTAKLDSNGNFLWVIYAEGVTGQAVFNDSDSNTYIGGYFYGTAEFGNTELISSGGADIFIAKLDPEGNFLWAKKAGGIYDDVCRGVCSDNYGAVYTTGTFYHNAYFDKILLSSPDTQAIFTAKLGSDEQVRYSVALESSPPDIDTEFTGQGLYYPGETVYITAYNPDYLFIEWTGNPEDIGLIEDSSSPSTAFIMPQRPVLLTAVYAFTEKAVVYRFFNTLRGGHLYTISEYERDYIIQNLPDWSFEGPKFRVWEFLQPESTPTYRFFNTWTGIHIYTISEHERDSLMSLAQWNYEGIKFFVHEIQIEDTIPVYRFFNHVRGGHLYTISEAERDAVMQLPSWTYEGIKFYVFP